MIARMTAKCFLSHVIKTKMEYFVSDFNYFVGFVGFVARMGLSTQESESVERLASFCSSQVRGFLFLYIRSRLISCPLLCYRTDIGYLHVLAQTEEHHVHFRPPTLLGVDCCVVCASRFSSGYPQYSCLRDRSRHVFA